MPLRVSISQGRAGQGTGTWQPSLQGTAPGSEGLALHPGLSEKPEHRNRQGAAVLKTP